jgi:hypothetical protein
MLTGIRKATGHGFGSGKCDLPFLQQPKEGIKLIKALDRIELTLGIISASLPSLKPLFNWFLETAKAFTTNSRSRTGTQNSGFKRNPSLNYFKSDTFKSKNDGAFELASVTASERTENGGTSKGRDMYSVKVTGEGWDAEKGRCESDEAILPIQGGDGNEIRVTKSVVVL